MKNKDDKIIKKFHAIRGHNQTTIINYENTLKKYSDFHDLSIDELIKEALNEQNQKTPHHALKIYDRLLDFRTECLIPEHKNNSVLSHETRIKTFYKCHRIEVPFLPSINRKNLQKNPIITFDDILKKEEIIKGLNHSHISLKARIMMMISSGAAINETQSISKKMFFNATYSYHKSETLDEALEILIKKDDVVPIFQLYRFKTGKPYYSFTTPETVKSIVESIIYEDNNDLNDGLFKYSKGHVNALCKKINDRCCFGKAGGYSRFSPHMFRRFNSTQLNQGLGEENALTMDLVDNLQGRGKGVTREAYFKNNPEFLRKIYINSMNNVSLYNSYCYDIENKKIIVKKE